MRNLQLSTLSSQYRTIAKRYATIEKALANLPEPGPDFTGVAPYEHDLIEIYLHCFSNAHYGQFTLKDTKGFISLDKFSIDYEKFNELLNGNMSKENQNRVVNLLSNIPWRITKNPLVLICREKRPNLMKYFEQQKIDCNWLPPAPINENNLTWVGWDELLKLVEQYGYKRHSDDPSELDPINDWSTEAKDIIFHLMLEMINPDKIKDVWTEDMGRDVNDLVGIRQRPCLAWR